MIMTVGAEGQNRTDDTSIFSAVLYQLSYLGSEFHISLAGFECQAGPVSPARRLFATMLHVNVDCIPYALN